MWTEEEQVDVTKQFDCLFLQHGLLWLPSAVLRGYTASCCIQKRGQAAGPCSVLRSHREQEAPEVVSPL